MAMLKTWEDARLEGQAEGRAQGRAEAQAEARAQDVLAILRVRGIAVPAAARKRILAQKNLRQLERWLEKAVTATSVRQVIGAAPSSSRARSASR